MCAGPCVVMRREILAAYAAGTGCTILARQYGLSESTMVAWLHREGAAVRTYRTLTPQATPEMIRLRQDGWSLRQIAEKHGVTRQAVAMRLRRAAKAPQAADTGSAGRGLQL